MYTANRHRVSPEFIRSRNCVPMAFTTRESAGSGPLVVKVIPVTGAAFADHHGPINVRLSFPTPPIGMNLVGVLKTSGLTQDGTAEPVSRDQNL